MMPIATVVHKTRILRESCTDCATVADSTRLSGESDPRRILRAMNDAHESHSPSKGASPNGPKRP